MAWLPVGLGVSFTYVRYFNCLLSSERVLCTAQTGCKHFPLSFTRSTVQPTDFSFNRGSLTIALRLQIVAMLIAVPFLVGVAAAVRVCYEPLPKPEWLSHVPCSVCFQRFICRRLLTKFRMRVSWAIMHILRVFVPTIQKAFANSMEESRHIFVFLQVVFQNAAHQMTKECVSCTTKASEQF